MEYIVAFFLISNVYGIAYVVRHERLRVYRLSIVLLVVLAVLTSIVSLALTINDLKTTGRISNELLHAFWFQSLVCAFVSARHAIRSGSWNYLSHSIVFISIFIVIAILKKVAG